MNIVTKPTRTLTIYFLSRKKIHMNSQTIQLHCFSQHLKYIVLMCNILICGPVLFTFELTLN